MNSQTTPAFWQKYRALPVEVRRHARETYRLWRKNPAHPSLRFKRVKSDQPVYSVRIGLNYRALGLLKGDMVTWFWIGDHADYERLLR